jgi:RND superfamily putative drug exporter
MSHTLPELAEKFEDHPFAQPRLAHMLRLASVPMLLFWIGLTVVLNVFVPPLEKVGEAHTVSMSSKDAPSVLRPTVIHQAVLDDRRVRARRAGQAVLPSAP